MTPTPPEASQDSLHLLGLAPNPTYDQIRRAYKKACLRHHPDKHPAGAAREAAEVTFKQVSLAYNELMDAATTPVTSSNSSPPASSGGSPTDDASPDDGFSARASDAPDHEVKLWLTLEEFASGCVKRHLLRVPGVPDADHPTLSITVRPGYRPGDRFRFRGAWNAPGPCGAADVVFVLSALPHPLFELDGDDLWLVMRLALVDALTGTTLAVPGLDGRPLNLVVKPVIAPDTEHRLCGRGMPCRADPSMRGDLRVAFDITFPKRVDPTHRPALRDLFARLDGSVTPSRRYIRRSRILFFKRTPAHVAARRSTTAPEADMGTATDTTDAHGKPPRKMRWCFASIFRN